MKKLFVISLMAISLGSTAFARMDNNDMGKPLPPHLHKMKRMKHNRQDPEIEKIRIVIDEKRLEIRKELLNEKPDWNKIEKLNVDIATQEAKIKTCRMRDNYEREYSNQVTQVENK